MSASTNQQSNSSPPRATISIRWLLPFIRVLGQLSATKTSLPAFGIALQDLTDPDMRLDHQNAMNLLRQAVMKLEDPRLGLRAGEGFELGDFDVLEYASRSCSTLRQAILCVGRYMGLMHGAQEAVLIEQGERARWEIRITDGVDQPPAANDFAVTSALMYGRRYTGRSDGLLEVHLRHCEATDLAEYTRIFCGAKVVLGAAHNALVLASEQLDWPMSMANSALQAAYEARARQLLERLERSQGISGRVRSALVNKLNSGDASVSAISRQLGMSASGLRRKLAEENTTFSELLDDLRRELSRAYLRDRTLAISEVAFLLGFSHAPSFNKAFRRWWGGQTPSEYRAQQERATDVIDP